MIASWTFKDLIRHLGTNPNNVGAMSWIQLSFNQRSSHKKRVLEPSLSCVTTATPTRDHTSRHPRMGNKTMVCYDQFFVTMVTVLVESN
jgi:hypothetical protein